jgi:hypothetical protein
MAIEDSLGRTVEMGAQSMADIKAMLSSLMQGKVGAATKVGDGKAVSDEKLKEVVELLDKLNSNMAKELEETKKYLGDVVRLANAKSGDKEKPGLGAGATEAVTSTEKYIKELHKHATTAGSLYVADVGTHKLLGQIIKEVYNKTPIDVAAEAAMEQKKTTETTTTSSSVDVALDPKMLEKAMIKAGMDTSSISIEQIKDITKAYNKGSASLAQTASDISGSTNYELEGLGTRTLRLVNDFNMGVQQSLFGLGEKGSLAEQAFGGIVTEQVKFLKDSRAVAYQVAGITSETRGLQKEFTKLENSAYLTGFGRVDLQKQYLANVSKGIKDQKVAKALSVTQLQTAKQLGLEANAFDETFREMNIAGGMTVNQISDMANGMKAAAKSAGITGDQLKKAVDSAQQINKAMIAAATLTSAAAKNVTSILASSEKFGVGDQAAELLKAASSSSTLLLSASDETKNLLYNAAASVGKVGELQKGILLRSRSGIKDLRKGFDNILRTFGVESAEAIDNLSDESKMQLNIQLKSAFGMELGEFQNQIKALKEQESTLADKMAEINKERKKSLSTEERLALAEKERKAKIEASVGALAALEEASKGAKDMNQALRKFGDRKSEFESDIKALGGDFRSSASAAKTALTSAIENVNEGLTKAGKAKLEISSDEITKALKDPTALKEITAKITKGNQEMETAQQAALDPMSKVEQTAREINDNFSKYSGQAIASLTDIVGNTGMMAAAFGSVAAEGFLSLGDLSQKLGPAFASIAGFFKASMQQGEENTGFGKILSTLYETGKATISSAFGVEDIMEKYLGGMKAAGGMPSAGGDLAEKTSAAAGDEAAKEAAASSAASKAPPAPTPKAIATDNAQAALELLLEQMNIVSKTVKDNMVTVKMEDHFYDAWKLETKRIVRAILQVSKKEMSAAEKSADEALGSTKAPAGEAAGEVAAPSGGLLDFLKDASVLEQAGDALMEYGPLLAVMAAGLVAVATAVMAVMNQVFKFTGLDMATAAQTAATIGIVLGATAAIFAATIAGYKVLADMKGELEKLNWQEGAKVGIKLSALAIGLSALALATIFVIKTMSDMAGMDIKTAAETGANIAAVLGVVAAIAAAVQETLPKLIEFAPILDQAKSKVGQIVKGGAALLILAPAMVLLGLAVLKIIELMGWAFGIDFNKAIEIGYMTAAIIGVTAAIALGVMAAMGGLYALGFLASGATQAIAGYMALGAAALLVLAPAVALLGLALLSMIDGLAGMFEIDAAKAYEIGELFSAVIWTAGQIALYTIAALGGLFLLGSLAAVAYGAAAMALLGGAALMILAPAIFDLGAILIKYVLESAEGIGLDLDSVLYAGQLFVALVDTIGLIAYKMIPALAGLAILGELTTWLWWTIPLILLGIGAFSAGMLTFGLLAYEIGLFGRHLEDMGLSTDTLETINTSITMMEGIFRNIASTLQTFANEILPLFDGFLFFDSVADDILEAMPQIKESFYGITTFIYEGILLPVLLMPPPAMLQKAQDTLSALPPIFSSIASVINTLANEIAPLFDGFLWFNSVADDINDALPEMKKTIPSILRFVEEAIVDPVFANIGNPRDVKMAAEALEGVAKVIDVLPNVISGVSDNLQPLLKKGWWSGLSKMDNVEKTIEEIGGKLGGVFKFIDGAIITPIFDNIGNPRDVKIAAEALEGVAKMLPLIPDAINGISKHIAPLTKPSWWSGTTKIDNAKKAANDIGSTFADLCKFVDVAIITPIFENIGNPRDVKIAAEALEGVAKMLPLLPDVVNGISKNIKPLVKKGGLFGPATSRLENVQELINEVGPQFANIFKFVDEGIITPIFENIGNPRDVKIAAEALKATNELLTMLPSEIIALTTNMNSMSSISKFVSSSFDPNALQGVMFVMSKSAGDLVALNNYFQLMAGALENILASMQKINTIGGNLAAMNMEEMGANIKNGLEKIKGVSGNLSGVDLGNVAASIDGTLNKAAGASMANVAANNMALNVTGGAVPTSTQVAATAPPMTNMATEVQQRLEMQAATAPVPTNINSAELSELNDNAAKELSVNEQMKGLLQQILAALSPAQGGAPPASITPANITTNAGNMFRLATGRYSESSAVGVTNL